MPSIVQLVLSAVGTGIFLSFGFGSVFFALIQSSIDYGFRAGRSMAFGVAISDVALILLAVFGTQWLPQIPDFEFYARTFSVILLLGLGIAQFRQAPVTQNQKYESGVKNTLYFAGKGMLLNSVNPVNFFSWVVVSATLKTYHYSLPEEFLFFVICILSLFATETLIAFYAQKIRQRFSPNVIAKIKRINGIIFLLIALKLAFDTFFRV